MISVTDQINAVLSAPIPFFFALFAVLAFALVAIWRAFEWRYAAVIEKTRTLLDLARFEAQAEKQKVVELTETMKKQAGEIDALKEKAEQVPEMRPLLANLSATTSTANLQLVELEKASTAVSETLRRGAVLTDVGTLAGGPLTLRNQ
jgi:hypothetical protein